MAVYVSVITIANLFMSTTAVYLSIQLGRMRRRYQHSVDLGITQGLLVQAFIRKGIELRCDYCGNPMAPGVPISIVEQEDGTPWVQHSSHGVS